MSELTREQVEKLKGIMACAVNSVDLGGSLTHVGVDLAIKLLIDTDAILRTRVAELEQRRHETVAMVAQLQTELATATAQATFTQHRFDDAIEAIDRLTKENADLRLALLDELNKKKG